MQKRELGAYYTELFNPFASSVFREWVEDNDIKNKKVLEPFAGNNSIIHFLQEVGMASKYKSYDVSPSAKSVERRNTLNDYPQGFDLCVTNPPWFYRSSAKRRQAKFPDTEYDNIYKLSLDLALQHNKFIAMLLPASFVACKEERFFDRLDKVILLNRPLFSDTENPVCLALFGKESRRNPIFYDDEVMIGDYKTLLGHMPSSPGTAELNIKFNVPAGELGLIAIDNNKEASIRFCKGEDLNDYEIKHSSRSITRISGDFKLNKSFLEMLNAQLAEMRKKTADVFLTPFKGLREDGKYRRRMNYSIARELIGDSFYELAHELHRKWVITDVQVCSSPDQAHYVNYRPNPDSIIEVLLSIINNSVTEGRAAASVDI